MMCLLWVLLLVDQLAPLEGAYSLFQIQPGLVIISPSEVAHHLYSLQMMHWYFYLLALQIDLLLLVLPPLPHLCV
eukprot:6008913-Ditylum_brightwellii.AAC.2